MTAMDRRGFLRSAAVLAAGVAGAGGWSRASADVGAAPAARRKPNIVLIFADDLGWTNVGYNGNCTYFETPVLDRLAKEGMVFTAAYAAAGNCAPSRACLLSGTYTPRHGVYAVGSTDRGDRGKMRLEPVPNRGGLPESNVTLADALKAAGYATGHFGKWHLMHPTEGALPSRQGFDVTFDSFGEGERPQGSEGNLSGPPADPKGVFTLTRKACDFIEKNKDRPFFVYLAHHAIHTPLQGQAEAVQHFRNKPPCDLHSNPKEAACTYALDASVGILLGKLKELGLEQDTLVIFTSDNGGVGANEPLRGAKGGYYEGGIREPFIARWSGVIAPGTTCDTPVINVDLYPTFLAAAGAAAPEGKLLDGESLLPLMTRQGPLRRQSIFWHFPGYLNGPVRRGRDVDVRGGFRTRPVSVINKGGWKLHLFHEEWLLDGGREKIASNRCVELYNLKQDIGEKNDLAATHPAKRDELLDELLAWQRATQAPLPTRGDPSAPAGGQDGGKKNRKGKKRD